MKKIIIGFVAGILFASVVSFAELVYKKTTIESWNGEITAGQRFILVDEKCTQVRVYPASSRMTDIKVDPGETLRINLVLKK